MAAIKEAVKDYQRLLAQLAATHAKAKARLEAVAAKRAEVVAEHDARVAEAEEDVRRSVVDIAAAFGAQTAAELASLEPAEVRRLARVNARR